MRLARRGIAASIARIFSRQSSEPPAKPAPRNRLVLEPIESRILLSADPVAAGSLVVVDGSVADHAQFSGSEVLVLDQTRDGIAQISEALASRSRVSELHVFSHGASGSLALGATTLDASSLAAHEAQLRSWADALSADADILFYGCNVAAEDAGIAFVEALSGLTSADIAASTDFTGSDSLGGDWILEYASGAIEVDALAASGDFVLATVNYNAATATLTFTADNDEADSVTITSPAASQLRIQVGAADQIALAGDTGSGFTLNGPTNTILDVDISSAPIIVLSVTLDDADDVRNDTLSLTNNAANGLGAVSIDGGAGTDSVTLNSVTLGGNLTLGVENAIVSMGSAVNVASNIINASGAIVTFAGTGAAATTTLTAGSFSAGTLNIGANNLTVNMNAATTATSLNLSAGTLGGTGDVTLSGSSSWSAGTMTGTGDTNTNGGLNITGIAAKFLSGGRTLNTAGTTNWSGSTANNNGEIQVSGGSTISNTGTWNDLHAFNVRLFNNGGGANVFNNSGTYTSSAAGETAIGLVFNNTSVVEIDGGALSLASGGTHTGSFNADNGTTLEFGDGNHQLEAGSSVSVAGTLALSGGAGSQFVLDTSATISGAITKTGAGTATIAPQSGSITPTGISVTNGTLHLTPPPTQTSLGPLNLSVGNAGTANLNNAEVTLANLSLAGTLGGTSNVTLAAGGTHNWTAGALAGNAATPDVGTFTVASGATLNASGGTLKALTNKTFINNGTVTLSGTDATGIDVNGTSSFANHGTFESTAGAGVTLSVGNLTGATGSLTFTNTGTLRQQGAGATRFNSGVTPNQGDVQVSAGTLALTGGTHTGSFNADTGATLEFGDGNHQFEAGSSVSVAGTLAVSGATGSQFVLDTSATISGAISKSGAGTATIAPQSGSITPTGISVTNGTLNLTPPPTQTALGPLNLTVAGAGAANLNNAEVTVANLSLAGTLGGTSNVTLAAGGTHNWTAGTLVGDATTPDIGTFTVASGATLNASGSSLAKGLTNKTFVNNGTVSLTGVSTTGIDVNGTSTFANNGTFESSPGAGATLRVGSFFGAAGTMTFTNTGTLRQQGAGVTRFLSGAAVNNQGAVEITAGRLELSGGGTHTGSFSANSGTALEFGGGTHEFGSGSSVTVAGTLDVRNPGSVVNLDTHATLSGAIVVSNGGIANLAPATGAIQPASIHVDFGGTLNLTPPSTQTTLGPLNVTVSNGTANLNNADVTVANLSLAGTLGGTSNVTLVDDPTITTDGTHNWTAGALVGNAATPDVGTFTVASGATLNASGTSFKALTNKTFINDGTLRLTGADATGIDVNGTSSFANNGTFQSSPGAGVLLNVGGFVGDAGTMTFTNNGTLRQQGAGTTTFGNGATVNNQGAADVTAGRLNLAGGGTHTGSFATAAGTTLEFGGGTHNVNNASAVSSLGTLLVSNATVNTTGTLTTGGLLQLAGGTLNAGGVIEATTYSQNGGTLTGVGTVNVAGQSSWTGGPMTGTGITNTNGGLSLTGSAKVLSGGRTLNTAGTTNWSGSTGGNTNEIFISGGSSINNSGTWNDQNTHLVRMLDLDGGGNEFNNAGTYTRSGAGGETQIGIAFDNAGVVNSHSGILSLDRGGASSGAFNVAGGVLEFGGGAHQLQAASSVSGAGATVRFDAGTVNVTGTYDVSGATAVRGGTANFTGTVDAVGALAITGGTANFSSGELIQASTFSLSSGATLSGSDTVDVTGLSNWTGGSMTGSGVTNTNGGLNITGSAAKFLSGGRTLNTAGATNWSGSSGTNSNEIALSGGSTINNTGTWNDQNAHALRMLDQDGGANEFNNTGTYTRSGVGGETLISIAFDNAGVVNAASGILSLDGGGASAGSFNVAGAVLEFGGGTHDLGSTSSVNSTGGTVRFDSGTTNLAGTYDVTGTTAVRGGTANFTGTVEDVGALAITGGNANFSSGEPVQASTLALATPGTLSGTDTVSVTGLTTWTGGTMSGTGRTDTNGLNITGINPKLLSGGRALNTAGTTSWSGSTVGNTSDIVVSGGSSIVNSGTWNDENAHNTRMLNNGGAASEFTNSGTYNKTGGGHTQISIGYDNSGTLNVQAGVFEVSGALVQTGTINLNGTTLRKPGGFANAGTLSGAGTVNVLAGNTFTSSGTLRPGGSPGLLTITGNLALTSTSVVDFELAGLGLNQFDRFAVSGTAALEGTANIIHFGGFEPAILDSFRVIESGGARSGAFATVNVPAGASYNTIYGTNDVTFVRSTAVNEWNTDASGNWEDAANWTLGVPVAGQLVKISRLSANPTVTVNSAGQIAGILHVDDNLHIVGGSLEIQQEAEINGGLTISGGTLTGAGAIAVDGPFSWLGGSITGDSSLTTNGLTTVSGAVTLDVRDWANTGTVNQNLAGRVNVTGAALVENRALANWNLSTSDANPFSSDGRFDNDGVLRKLGANTQAVSVSNFESSGQIFVSAGALALSAAEIDFTAANSVFGPGQLALQGPTDSTAIVVGAAADSGAGTLDITDGDIAALSNGIGLITIGRATGTAAVTVDASGAAFRDNLMLQSNGSGGSIAVDGSLATTAAVGAASLSLFGEAGVAVNAALTTRGGLVQIGSAGAVTSSAAGDITTTAGTNTGAASGGVQISGSSISLAGDVVTKGATNSGGAGSAGGAVSIAVPNGSITLASVDTQGGAGHTAANGGNGGAIVVSASTTTVNGALVARGAAGSTSGGSIEVNVGGASGLTTLRGEVATTANNITLRGTGVHVESGAPITTTGASSIVKLDGLGGAVTLGDDVSAVTVDLNAGAGVEQSPGSAIIAANLRVTGSGAFTLNSANDVDTLAAAMSGALDFRDGDDLTVGTVLGSAGIGSGNGDINLLAGTALTIDDALDSGTGVIVLAAADGVVFTDDAVLNVDLGGTAAGTFTRVQVGGALTLDGVLDVDLVNAFAPADADRFRFMTFGARTGFFDTTSLPTRFYIDETVASALDLVFDTTSPDVTIDQAAGQEDPTNDSPVTFTVVFSEIVSGFSAADVSLAGSTVGGTLAVNVTGAGAEYTVTVTGMDGDGLVVATIGAAAADDRAGNDSLASTSTDNSVRFDNVAPTVTINQAAGQEDPTNGSPIDFTVVFSEPVFDFTAADVSLAGSTVGGTLTAAVSGSGDTYTVSVSGMDSDGLVVASIANDAANDAAGNTSAASTSTDNSVRFDNVAPTVTIDQAAGQEDPTNDSPIVFTVVFSEVITGFTAEDVSLAGSTVGGTLTATVTGSGAEYTVAVSGMDGVGTVIASVVGGAASDAAGNASAASTSTDNSVTFDNVMPTVTIDQAAGQADPADSAPILFTVVFSEMITGFAAADISFAGSTVGGVLAASVSGSGTLYTVSVNGMAGSGTVVASVVAGAASDAAGNASAASTSTDNTVTFNDNEAPLAVDDTYATNEDTALTLLAPGVLANDLDEDTLQAFLVSGPLNGTLTLNTDGSFTYTPNLDFDGVDTFTYRADDGFFSDVGEVTITVNAVNDAPVATDDSYATDEDTPLTITMLGVLANDSDVDSSLIAVLETGPAHGTLVFSPDGSFTYTPNLDYSGTDSFTYRASDGPLSDFATVHLTINAVNDAPVAGDDSYTTGEDTPLTIVAPGVLGNDADVDSALIAVLDTGPAHGTLVLNSDGSFTYTPNLDYNGADSFTYRASDGPLSDFATVHLTISAVNDAPVAVDDTYTTDEDTPLTVDMAGVLANDSDVDSSLTALLETGPAHGTLIFSSDGSFTYTPNLDYNGADSFTYRVSDGPLSDMATVHLTINAVNDAPVAADDSYATDEDTPLTITAPGVLGNDGDVDSVLSVILQTGPAHGMLVFSPDGTFTYTPNLDYSGADSFTYRASDGPLSDLATVHLTINAVNDAPVAIDDTYTTDEDNPLTVTAPGVLGNDDDVDSALSAVLQTGPAHGTLVFSPDGSFTYTPNLDYNGADSFTYRASDGPLSDIATVHLTVAAVNDAPVAGDDSYTTGEDAPLTIVSAGVLGNDADVDSALTAVLDTAPVHGALVFNSDGSFTYTPNLDFNGTDTFTYRASDGGLDDVGTVTITVNAVDDAGEADDDAYTVNEDGLLTVVAPGVLANDSDVDSTPSALLVDDVDSGTLLFESDGSFIYAPDLDFNGIDTFTYRLSDGDSATVTITVATVNDGPVAVDDSATTAEDAQVDIAVVGNDTDVENHSLTVSSVGTALHGTVTLNPDGTLRYTPNADYHGPDSFEYTVTDGEATDVGTVSITVTPVNDAPVAVDDLATTDEALAVTIPVIANDSDVDGDGLTVESVAQAANGTVVISAGGAVTYTPNAGFSGTDGFDYTVSDGQGGTDTGRVTVMVNATGNDAPVFVEIADQTVTEGCEVRFTVAAADADDAAASLVFNATDMPDGATFDTLTQQFVWIPADDATAAVTFTVLDPHGAVDTMDVVLTATNVAATVDAGPDQLVGLQNKHDHDDDDDDGRGHGHGNGHGHKKGEATVDIAASFNDLGTLDTHTAIIDWGDGHVSAGTVGESPFGPPGSTAGANGTVTGTHTYRRAGVYTVKVIVTDDDGASRSDTLTVTVKDPDKHLKARGDEYRLVEDAVLSVSAANGVLRNDRGALGSLLQARLVEGPEHGILAFNADGSFTYQPDADFHGVDSFWYEFTDGANVSKAVKVQLKVRDDGQREACIDWGGRPGWSLPPSGKHPNIAEFLVKLASRPR